MTTSEPVYLVLTNLPDEASAHALARQLVEARLAACVNLLPGVQSIYRWQGVVEQAGEVTALIKTTQSRLARLEAAILESHPYELPEILSWPVTGGHPAYLQWVRDETAGETYG